jgi:hypothetical protein
VAAHAISRRRERRFLQLVEAGATIAEAARATRISRETIYRRRREDVTFAQRLDLARLRVPGPPVEDWTVAAAWLETAHPERWSVPELPDPFDPTT